MLQSRMAVTLKLKVLFRSMEVVQKVLRLVVNIKKVLLFLSVEKEPLFTFHIISKENIGMLILPLM